MPLRQKYVKILSRIVPAGAVGVSLLLGATAAGVAKDHPAGTQPPAADAGRVSERLTAIREAVSDLSGPENAAKNSVDGNLRLAWGNWWRNGGWGYYRPWGGWGWPNWNNWHNWNNWGNWFRNW